MVLLFWFPSPHKQVSEQFTSGVLTVEIDRYKDLTHEYASFLYRALIRSAHKQSLLLRQKGAYSNDPNFKSVFSFTPFTPPWFVRQIYCRFSNKSVYKEQIQFEEYCIPRMKTVRSRAKHVLTQLQGIIAAFASKEP